MSEHKEIAKITNPFLGIEQGYGIFTTEFTADYGGSAQVVGGFFLGGDTGFGAAFIKHLLRAAGVSAWDELDGRVVYVIQDSPGGRAIGIENLPFEPGERFIFQELAEEYRKG